MNKVFLFLLFGVIGFSQSLEGESFRLNTIDGISTFTFEDKNSNGRWISGTLVKNYLKLSFNQKDFDKFKSNLKKVSKKSEYTIETETYALDKYSWDDSNMIYVRVGDKIGEFTKKEVKKLLK
jgi:hypothetical protein|tara:strand:+ start:225 stop:593 length:369 start_codon:yes stop_codon:yes gene_type:complete